MSKYQVQEVEKFDSAQGKIIQGENYFIIETGKSCRMQKDISDHLQKQRPNLKEVQSVDDCNVILVFCPIFSRAGTDIDAALKKLNTYSASKPAIFMVFHHTFDPDKIVPDSSRCVIRKNTLTVDCLFSEDEGLLTCNMNEQALAKIVQCFKYQGHLEIQQMVKCIISPMISLPFMLCKYLLRFRYWRFGTLLASIWNYITRRETHESSTSNKRNRPKDTDEDKNV